MCLLAGLLNSSHAVLYGFGTLHWRSLGISNGLIGLLWTVGVLAEIVIFPGQQHYKLQHQGFVSLARAFGLQLFAWLTFRGQRRQRDKRGQFGRDTKVQR